jgi:hypothetical protein
MTHPNQPVAELACAVLLRIQGVFSVCVRGVPDGFVTPEDLRAEAERAATREGILPLERQAFVDAYFDKRHKEYAKELDAAESPFPHVVGGPDAVTHYLRRFTDMLGPGYDERIDAKIGEIRIVTESWGQLIVSVAIRVRDPGAKSLARGLRRAQKKVEGP